MCGGVIPLVVLVPPHLTARGRDIEGREVGGEREQGAVRLEHLRLAPSVVVEFSLSIVPLSTTMFRFRFGSGFGFRSPCRDRND